MTTKNRISKKIVSYYVTATSEAVEESRVTTQAISYIPYGEVFVEQQSGGWSSPYLFNAKELDSETGLYYYGARYLDPSDAMWLSVDPLWEKNIDASPYSYCHGNPIKMIDPDGKDDYGVDEDGNIFLIKKTDDKTDFLYANVYKNRKGKVKGLGENNNKIEIQKGILVYNENPVDEHNVIRGQDDKGITLRLLDKDKDKDKDKKQGRELFDFLSENTKVEWAFFNSRNDIVNNFFITSSRNEDSEGRSNSYLQLAKKSGKVVDFHIHSHPKNFDYSVCKNAEPSKADMEFAERYRLYFPKMKFSVFTKYGGQKCERSY